MGFFDSSSETTNLQTVNNRNVAAEGLDGLSVVASENVNVLDGGAISGIQNVAANAIAANAGLTSESLDFGLSQSQLALYSVGAAFEQAGSQIQRILETTTGGSPSSAPALTRLDIQNNMIRYGALALIAGVGFYYWKKG